MRQSSLKIRTILSLLKSEQEQKSQEAKAMIYTVTFNPSVDYVVRLDEVETGGLNRTSDTEKYAGGKGINVSRVLKQLGKESTALGFCGGFSGGVDQDTVAYERSSERFSEIE